MGGRDCFGLEVGAGTVCGRGLFKGLAGAI